MDIYVGNGKFMLQLKNRDDFDRIHEAQHSDNKLPSDFGIHYHNIEFSLVNASNTQPMGHKKTADYVNYFLGDDPSRWAGGVQQFSEVSMANVYPGVEMVLSSIGNHAKYEFRLKPNANPSDIQFEISGADDLYLADNRLHIDNSCDMLIDEQPVAWQVIDGVQRFVRCSYSLSGDTLGFQLGEYDPAHGLIIDPTLIFSTFTGSNPTDNWGSTATYDSLGNLYAGGIVISSLGGGSAMNGYPTTTGAYQTTYAGGANGTGTQPFGTDIVISKFNDAGSTMIYSTYLGGNNNEIPHSLVVNSNNELYVLGTTSSDNFPTSSSCFDNQFSGGSAIGVGTGNNNNSNSVSYPNGSDIIITKFNAAGTGLLASTYIGGTGNDGINLSDTLQKAYADEFRGEIIVDANDNCYVATSTGSDDFPTPNGFQNTYAGGVTDGVVFKFNSNLSNLIWSTYIGGADADGAYSLQFDPSANVFVTGGTKSDGTFPVTTGALHTSYQGGICDGWVAKISNNGQTLLASTFLGTNSYDQSFFVQLDLSGYVYCVGQTLGNYPIGPSWVYSVNNSGQFLHKLTNNLQTTVFSTRWGTGNNAINLSLSAFLVNECNHIFIAGWGGTLFGTGSVTSGTSTTSGLPWTPSAYQNTTDGNDMYFLVFEDSAKSVLFASYFGGTGASGREHVDGGTSRFDKKGIIYQAVCAGCGGGNAFPTTSGSWSTTNGSNNCNLGAIKYDLVTLEAEADLDGPNEVCVNDSIQFDNQSFGGSLYLWDFGDGETSTEFEPKHAYSSAGQYLVTLIIYDSVSCVFSDTDKIELTVMPGPVGHVPSVPEVCPGTPIQLSASGGSTYQWTPTAGLDDPNIPNPIATISGDKIYKVYITDSCGTDTITVHLKVHENETDAMPDTALCKGQSGRLRASGGVTYQWNPGIYLSSTSAPDPLCSPDTTTFYEVTIADSFGCERIHEITVFVEGFVPQVEAWGDTTVCQGDRILLNAKGTNNYQWSPSTWILDPQLNVTPAYPEESVVYYVYTHNSCGAAYDSVNVLVNPIELEPKADTSVCGGDSVYLGAYGSLLYKWTGPAFSSPNQNQFPVIVPDSNAWYYVTGSNINGCSLEDSLYVTVHPRPKLRLLTNEDTITGLENVSLVVRSSAPHRWYSEGYIPCATCDTIVVYPLQETEYFVEVIDSNQCRVADSLTVEAISKIFAPNTFTPDGDGNNELFKVQGHNIINFSISIRDRWGHEVYRSNDMDEGWNGRKYNTGKALQIGVYSYEVRYTVLPDQDLYEMGKVSLLR